MAFFRRCVPVFLKVLTNVSLATQSQKIHRWVAPTLKEFKRREDKLGGKKTNPRNTFLEWNLEAELYAFGKRLNEDFDSDLLLVAFTDRSYVIKEEMKQKEMNFDIKMKDNRELAAEGEKFMEEYIQIYLETVLPKFPLDGVKGVHKYLLSKECLAHVSLYLGTKDIILAAAYGQYSVSNNILKFYGLVEHEVDYEVTNILCKLGFCVLTEYPVDNYILANTFKALVGCLKQSSGDERAAHFVRDFVITQLQGKDVNDYWHIEDPWTMLTGLLSKSNTVIEPRLIAEVGKNTLLACYRVGLYIDKKMLSSGFGETIAIAKEMAAREALKKVFGTEDSMAPINFKLQGIPKASSQARYQISAS